MSFRLVKVSGFYDGFLKNYYQTNPDILCESYKNQYSHLMSQGFAWSDYLCAHLRSLGVDASELISNAAPLNHAWAAENGIDPRKTDVILARIKRLQPDVVFLQDTARFNTAWCERLRQEVPSIKALVGWRASPFTRFDIERFRAFDLILTCTPALVREFEAHGVKSALLYHGFEKSLVPLLSDETDQSAKESADVVFAGSLIQARGYHYGRIKFLSELVDNQIPLRIHSETASTEKLIAKRFLGQVAQSLDQVGLGPVLKRVPLFTRALQWRDVKVNDPIEKSLRACYDKPAYGLELYRLMHRSKVCLNFHIDFAGDYAGNSRLFEATGAGTCLMTDRKKNLPELFEPDTEVVTFGSTAECIEKVRWLLENPKKREEIAKAGQARCLRDHSLQKRAIELHSIVSNCLT